MGVDPTNRLLTGERHVKIGHGRHYSDVPPVKGVYRGASGSRPRGVGADAADRHRPRVSVLLGVPNVSEGRDRTALDAIGAAFGPGVFDVHADPDHHRAVFTLAGEPGALAAAMLDGAREAVARIDLARHAASIRAWARSTSRRSSTSTTPTAAPRSPRRSCSADLLGAELELPVYLYGALAGGRTRAELRRPGALDGLTPDFGPPRLHPTAGAVLVAARPPLVAFNVEVDGDARRRPPDRRGDPRGRPHGLPSVRALGLELRSSGAVQVLDQHRGPPRDDARGRSSRRSPRTRRSAAPSSSPRRRRPRSPTSRPTSRCRASTRTAT